MNVNDLKKQTLILYDILPEMEEISNFLRTSINWDNSIKARKTFSFGVPYNYSNINYKKIEIPAYFQELLLTVNRINGFLPNNCLINYYYENKSKMGFHSDQTDILALKTGVAIFSFGSKRILRFKSKLDSSIYYDFTLKNNSYFYMSQEVQKFWLHSILEDKSTVTAERFSITLRKILI